MSSKDSAFLSALQNLPCEVLEMVLDYLSFQELLDFITVCSQFYGFITSSNRLNTKIKLVIDMNNFLDISKVLLASSRPFFYIHVKNDIYRSDEKLLQEVIGHFRGSVLAFEIGTMSMKMIINLDFLSEILFGLTHLKILKIVNVGFITDAIEETANIKQPMFKSLELLDLTETWTLWTMESLLFMFKNCKGLIDLSKLMTLTHDSIISDVECNVHTMWNKFLRRQRNLKKLFIDSNTATLFLSDCLNDAPFSLTSFIYKENAFDELDTQNIANLEKFLEGQKRLRTIFLKLSNSVNFSEIFKILQQKTTLKTIEINPSEEAQLTINKTIINKSVHSLDLLCSLPIKICKDIISAFSTLKNLSVRVLCEQTKTISFDDHPSLQSVSLFVDGAHPLNQIESQNITSLILTDAIYSVYLNWLDLFINIPNIVKFTVPLKSPTCLTLILQHFKKLEHLDCTSAKNMMRAKCIPVICKHGQHLKWIGVKFVGHEKNYKDMLKEHNSALKTLNHTFLFDN